MASPGSMDLDMMANDCLGFFKQVNPKGYEDCMTYYKPFDKYDDNYIITRANVNSDMTKQILFRTGIIRCIYESGYDGSLNHGKPDVACGFFMMEPGCGLFTEEERQRLSSRKDNFVEQWEISYYNNFVFWINNCPGKPWKINSIFQLLFFNHFPAYTGELFTKYSNTRMFRYEAQAWRYKWHSVFNKLILIDPLNRTPAMGQDFDSHGFNFKSPGLLDPSKALTIADAFGKEDDTSDNSASDLLFSTDSDRLLDALSKSQSKLSQKMKSKTISNIIY